MTSGDKKYFTKALGCSKQSTKSHFSKTLKFSTDQEKELHSLISEMGKIYGSAKVCPKNDSANCFSLSSDLTRIMSSSIDYEEITYYWEVSKKYVMSIFN